MTTFKFTHWPTKYKRINQPFGTRPNVYGKFGLPGHEGFDIAATKGSEIYSVADGVVYQVVPNPRPHNYGIHVRIKHINGYKSIYAHSQEVLVNVGDVVKGGQVIALADNTGNSFGHHLHFTLKNKENSKSNWPYDIIDPTRFFASLLYEIPSARVRVYALNVRSTPQIQRDNKVGRISSGTIVKILDHESEYPWANIE